VVPEREPLVSSQPKVVMNDLKFAVRQLLKNPGFTTIAVLTLALGIGANTAIFSVINAVLLQPLPFKDPDQLVAVWERYPKQGNGRSLTAPANFADWKSQNEVFEGIAAFDTFLIGAVNLTGGMEPERVSAVAVSGDLFDVLGIRPFLGRSFAKEDEIPGQNEVVILSHSLWQRRFGGDVELIGKKILLDGQSYVVVGIMPRGFVFPGGTGAAMAMSVNKPAELWVPLSLSADVLQRSRSYHHLQVIGRLKRGVTLERARTAMDSLMQGIEKANPGNYMGTHCLLRPLHENSVGGLRYVLIVLFGAVGFVLLIACTNVANLLLTRAAAREKEFAIRTAIGASRSRVIRQLLTESLLLSLVSGALGVLLAWWSVRILSVRVDTSISAGTAGWGAINIDLTVLLFTFAIALAIGSFFGLTPALQSGKLDIVSQLKEQGRGSSAGVSRKRFRSFLIVAEVALATMLSIGAGLMMHSLIRLQRVDPGFNHSRVLTMELGLSGPKYAEGGRRAALLDELIARIEVIPGVEYVGATPHLPLSGESMGFAFNILGRPVEPGKFLTTDVRLVAGNYLNALQIPLRAGRSFTKHDTANSQPVCLINQALANHHFGNENPIGKQLRLSLDGFTAEIVGIVQTVQHHGLVGKGDSRSEVYVPYAQLPSQPTMAVAVRARGALSTLARPVRQAVRDVDRDLPIARLRTMSSIYSGAVAQPRFRTLLISLFGGLALVLAAIGIYGVMSYSVSQRIHEIGIRMALGAKPAQVLFLILRQGMTLAVIGIIVGLISSIGLTQVIRRLLFGISATDPVTFVVVTLLLAGVAMLACWLPARRAARVEPMEALRYE
jgi:putative ABC transport system permease protein